QENRQKRNRKIPPPHGAVSCDSKSPSSAKTDSRSTPYEFFTGDSLESPRQVEFDQRRDRDAGQEHGQRMTQPAPSPWMVARDLAADGRGGVRVAAVGR